MALLMNSKHFIGGNNVNSTETLPDKHFPNSFYEACITMIPKSHMDVRNEKL